MREIDVKEITVAIKEMCIEATHFLSSDMEKALVDATATEEGVLGKQILLQLQENLEIAGKEMIPICQDTGMAVIFINIGQEVHFVDDILGESSVRGPRGRYNERCRLI